MLRPRPALLLWLAISSLGAGCKKPAADANQVLAQLPTSFPVTLDRTRYAGADSCKSCHPAEHAAWQQSPHGRSVLEPSAKMVLGDFSAGPLQVDGGSISFSREGGRYFMDLKTARGEERAPVDLVLGSGRQHQDYFTREIDPASGAERWFMMPAIWTTPKGPWLSTQLYQSGSLNPRSADYWKKRSLVELGCANCHVSQGGYLIDKGETTVAWKETRVNCESCHGPAAEHVAKKSAGQPGGALRDLTSANAEQDANTCGVCHGLRETHRAGADAAGWPWFVAGTLRRTLLRVDGTQAGTAYQFSGHELSECFRGGGLRCVSCHAPHSALARALDGESAVGKESDKQCIVCHRNYLDAKAARAHGHHQEELRCIDCHMARSFIGETAERHQATSDHTISIPRPAESVAYGTPDACTTCHRGKTAAWALEKLRGWGASRALGERPWLKAIALGRARAPGAGGLLAALLGDAKSGQYLRESALDLLEEQAPDSLLAPAIDKWTRDPDPWVRALALRALLRHDPARARETWQRGVEDPHAVVRLAVLPYASTPDELTQALLERDLRDDLDWAQRPEPLELANLARTFAGIGDQEHAFEVLKLVLAVSTPSEQEALKLGPLRERLANHEIAPASR